MPRDFYNRPFPIPVIYSPRMDFNAHTLETLFYSCLALYVLIECALTALHTHKAEHYAESIPPDFEGYTTKNACARAAHYTGEVAQSELILVFGSAFFAWFMTYGQGITTLAAISCTLLGPSQSAQWLTLAILLFLFLALEFFLGRLLRYRVKDHYRVKRASLKRRTLKALRETTAGWLVALPLIALLLTIFDLLGDYWWLVTWAAWLFYLFWRRQLGIVYGLFIHRRIRPVRDEALRAMVRDFLASQNLIMTDLVVTNRPRLWAHSHVVLSGWGRRRRVVLFSHIMEKLTAAEILALIAHDVGHIRHHHTLLRTTILALWGLVLAAFAGWGSVDPLFFDGFGVSRHVTFNTGAANAGWILAVASVTFPVLFYLLTPLRNLLSRALQYDADLHAARTVGAGPMIRALVKLHRDYSTTLWPSNLYSLFHYARPHVTMRVERLRQYLAQTGRDAEHPVVLTGFDRRKYAVTILGDDHLGQTQTQSSTSS